MYLKRVNVRHELANKKMLLANKGIRTTTRTARTAAATTTRSTTTENSGRGVWGGEAP